MAISDPQWRAYQTGLPIGLDLKRSSIASNLGTWVVNSSATFRSGMLVQLNSSQELIICDGTLPLGFAKYDATTSIYETIVDERIQLVGTTATSLAHANLNTLSGDPDNCVRVATGTQGSGTVYTHNSDYSVNTTNGTITRVGGGIPTPSYVYVTYMYEVPVSRMQFEGKNFWNTNNAVEYTNRRMAVVTGQSVVFTSQYDPRQVYAINSSVEAGATGDGLAGMVTLTGVGAGINIGRVIQVPSASDPFIGIQLSGITIAA